MLLTETTIGIYPNGELNDILIVPDGHEYHLFLTGTPSEHSAFKKATDMGSIVFVNNDWIYEGTHLSPESQKEIADYIFNYSASSDDQTALM